MNRIVITGRLTRDPELSTVSNGMEKCRFSVAVDRRRKKGAEQKTDFFDCAAWNATGAFVNQWFHKGDAITVLGRMESNKGEKDGVPVTYWTLSVDEVEFQKGRGRQDDTEAAPAPAEKTDPATGFTEVNTDEIPFE